ncbi:MAG: hypothetical protein ACM35E_05975, partial [Deltaproteobacteria bacterium]
ATAGLPFCIFRLANNCLSRKVVKKEFVVHTGGSRSPDVSNLATSSPTKNHSQSTLGALRARTMTARETSA